MYRTHILSMLTSAAFSLFMLFYGIPFYTPEYPGYGIPASTFPTILCTIILICSAINLVRVVALKVDKGVPAMASFRSFVGFCIFMVVLLLAMPFMQLVGFIPGGIILMLVLSLLCGERNYIRLPIVAVSVTLLLYAAFWYGLKVMLP